MASLESTQHHVVAPCFASLIRVLNRLDGLPEGGLAEGGGEGLSIAPVGELGALPTVVLFSECLWTLLFDETA